MGNPAIWTAIGVVVGVLATWLVMRSLRAAPREAERSVQPAISPTAPVRSDDSEVVGLRQNLRLKVMYDEAKIDRLIEAERQRTPGANLAQLMRSAIERWERDNR